MLYNVVIKDLCAQAQPLAISYPIIYQKQLSIAIYSMTLGVD